MPRIFAHPFPKWLLHATTAFTTVSGGKATKQECGKTAMPAYIIMNESKWF